jgi:hypothetical protein
MKKTMSAVLLAGTLLLNSGTLFAEEPAKTSGIDQDIQMLRKDLRDMKKKIVAANMELTAAEAAKFWPVYDEYTRETTRLNDDLLALIKEYAQTYDKMTDAQAQSLTKRALAADDAANQLRIKYVPLFTQAVQAKKTARFMQIDRRLALLVNVQLSSEIPLVQP